MVARLALVISLIKLELLGGVGIGVSDGEGEGPSTISLANCLALEATTSLRFLGIMTVVPPLIPPPRPEEGDGEREKTGEGSMNPCAIVPHILPGRPSRPGPEAED